MRIRLQRLYIFARMIYNRQDPTPEKHAGLSPPNQISWYFSSHRAHVFASHNAMICNTVSVQYRAMKGDYSPLSKGSNVNCSNGLILSSFIFCTSRAKTASGAAVESMQLALTETTTPPPTFRYRCAFRPTILAWSVVLLQVSTMLSEGAWESPDNVSTLSIGVREVRTRLRHVRKDYIDHRYEHPISYYT